jgi:hypothetical protein
MMVIVDAALVIVDTDDGHSERRVVLLKRYGCTSQRFFRTSQTSGVYFSKVFSYFSKVFLYFSNVMVVLLKGFFVLLKRYGCTSQRFFRTSQTLWLYFSNVMVVLYHPLMLYFAHETR